MKKHFFSFKSRKSDQSKLGTEGTGSKEGKLKNANSGRALKGGDDDDDDDDSSCDESAVQAGLVATALFSDPAVLAAATRVNNLNQVWYGFPLSTGNLKFSSVGVQPPSVGVQPLIPGVPVQSFLEGDGGTFITRPDTNGPSALDVLLLAKGAGSDNFETFINLVPELKLLPVNSGQTTAYILNQSGALYAFVVINPQAALQFYYNNIFNLINGSWVWDPTSEIGQIYTAAYNSFISQGLSINSARDHALAATLQGSGIKMTVTQYGINEFSKIGAVLASGSTTVYQTADCPVMSGGGDDDDDDGDGTGDDGTSDEGGSGDDDGGTSDDGGIGGGSQTGYNYLLELTEGVNPPNGYAGLNVGLQIVGDTSYEFYAAIGDYEPYPSPYASPVSGLFGLSDGPVLFNVVTYAADIRNPLPPYTGNSFKVAVNGVEYVVDAASIPVGDYIPGYLIAQVDLSEIKTLTVQWYSTTQPPYTPLPDKTGSSGGSDDGTGDDGGTGGPAGHQAEGVVNITNNTEFYAFSAISYCLNGDGISSAPAEANGGEADLQLYADTYNISINNPDPVAGFQVSYNNGEPYPVPPCAENHSYLFKTGFHDQSWYLDLPGYSTPIVIEDLDLTAYPANFTLNSEALSNSAGVEVLIQIQDQTEGIAQNWGGTSTQPVLSASIKRVVAGFMEASGPSSITSAYSLGCTLNGMYVFDLAWGQGEETAFSPGDTWVLSLRPITS